MNSSKTLHNLILRHLLTQIRYCHAEKGERTFIMVKPDGVQRGLVGKIIERFERKGFQLVALKMMCAGEDLLRKHYKNIEDKPFFDSIVKYMSSGPVVPMVWQGHGVVKAGRTLLGQTDPAASAPGTVRGDFAVNISRNVCHGSDSPETAQREIKLWFKDGTLDWNSAQTKWLLGK
ncbi:nucleoside diphosphate kinase-like [Atheta coriaria]|uniref:nucleoside diphosphate kinase-like n=1 Tax=Dalotia coriaria TaxID=877792 RepID=UPI0031F45027